MPEFCTGSTVTLHSTNASDNDVAMAAWVSFNRDDESRLEDRDRVGGLINYLLKNKHMSPFEHSHFTFRVDTPIFVAREFMRHRTMSFNEVSGRYTEMEPRFYIPCVTRPIVQEGKQGHYRFTRGTEFQTALVQRAIVSVSSVAWRAYQRMIARGIAKEVARMVLPLNLMTQFYATVSARNLLHFLELRRHDDALYEIREQVAAMMEAAIAEQMPLTYAAWKDNR